MRIQKLLITGITALFAVLAAIVAHADDADLSGTWALTVETMAGTGNPTFVLEQDGSKLNGKYRGQLGESDVTGTVDGDAFEISYNVSSPMGALDVQYEGTVENDEISGRVSMGDLGEGTFTGKRQ